MTSHLPSLLDEVLPAFDVAAKYSIRVQASPEKIYRILQKGIPTGSITKILMALRKVPRLFRKETDCPDYSFYKLKESQANEIVIGIVGQFWKPVASIVPVESLEEFIAFERNGYCKAAMNLRITPQTANACSLTTETRVISYGYAKERFLSYWQVIKPFSGLIRREILRKIKKEAEQLQI